MGDLASAASGRQGAVTLCAAQAAPPLYFIIGLRAIFANRNRLIEAAFRVVMPSIRYGAA
jgi:hypothetical protein